MTRGQESVPSPMEHGTPASGHRYHSPKVRSDARALTRGAP